MKFSDKYYESKEFQQILARYEAAKAYGRSLYMEPEELADIAEYYQMLGNGVEATNVLEHGLSMFPGSDILLALRARMALFNNNDIATAQQYVSQIVDTTSFEYYYIVAEIMLADKRPDDADQYLNDVVSKIDDEEERDDFYVDSAMLFADYNCYDIAATWLERSTDYEADDYKQLQGKIALHKGNYEESERIFNELLDRDPFSAPYWNSLASTQLLKGNARESIESSEYSIAINPEDPDALLNQANGLLRLGNYTEARNYYHRFSELYPDDEVGYLFEGVCCLNDESIDDAIAFYLQAEKVALQHQPASNANLLDIYNELALAYALKHDSEKAMSYNDKMAEIPDADTDEVLVMRGHLLMSMGQIKEGRDAYIQALKHSDGSPKIFLKIAISTYDLRLYDHSYRMFQFLRRNTDDSWNEGYSYEALCCYALHKDDEFLEAVKMAIEKNPYEAQLVLSDVFPPDLEVKDYYQWLLEGNTPLI